MGKSLVGNRKHARLVLDDRSPELNDDRVWEVMVEGSIRNVWLHVPTQVIYKTEIYKDEGWDNRTELRNVRALARMNLQHVRVPKTTGYHFDDNLVIAMEYVDGPSGTEVEPSDAYAARQELFARGCFADMHGHNFKVLNEIIVPIDLASPRVVPGSPFRRSHFVDDRVLTAGNGHYG